MVRAREPSFGAACVLLAALVALAGCGREPSPEGASDVQGQVGEIVASVLEVEPSTIDHGKRLAGPEIGADDIDVTEIIMETEGRFGIKIPVEKLRVAGTGTGTGTGAGNLTVERLAEIVKDLGGTPTPKASGERAKGVAQDG